jgi:hypothetical protein
MKKKNCKILILILKKDSETDSNFVFLISSIYNTQVKMEGGYNDPSSKMLTIDASKRQRDERLNRVMNQFNDNGFNDRRGGSINRASLSQKNSSSNKQNRYDDDDDDDIVAMMDRLNRI